MAKASKETLQVVIADMVLCSVRPTDDAKGRVFIFQGNEVILDGPIEFRISGETYLENLSEDELFEHGGSVKFTIKNELLVSPKYADLRELKVRDRALIEYGVSPKFATFDGGGGVSYANTKFLSIKKPKANSSGRTPAAAAASPAAGGS